MLYRFRSWVMFHFSVNFCKTLFFTISQSRTHRVTASLRPAACCFTVCGQGFLRGFKWVTFGLKMLEVAQVDNPDYFVQYCDHDFISFPGNEIGASNFCTCTYCSVYCVSTFSELHLVNLHSVKSRVFTVANM